jgi:hypothetical protein
MGDTHEEYMANAKSRALEIYHILFPTGADAMMFNHWLYDYCDSGDAEWYQLEADESMEDAIEYHLQCEADRLRFLLEQQFKNYCGSHRHNQCHQGWYTKYYYTANTEGQQCNDDKEHDILCVSPGTYVGSWGEINFIYIGWTSHCSSPFRP